MKVVEARRRKKRIKRAYASQITANESINEEKSPQESEMNTVDGDGKDAFTTTPA